MRRRTSIPSAAIALLLPALAFGEAGYSSANFLKIGMGARAAAMGDTFTALADDPTAVYWNPAGLALLRGTGLSMTHGEWLQGVSNDYLALSHRIGDGGGLGLGFTLQSVKSYASTLEDTSGNYAGTGDSVSASDWALSAAYADRIGRWVPGGFFENTYAGLKASALGQDAIENVGSAVSFELGLLHVFPAQNLTLGLDVQNVGSALQDRSQPVLFKAGAAWSKPDAFGKGDRMTLALDAALHDDTGFRPSFGVEYRTPLTSDFSGALRAGVRSTDDLEGFSNAAFGAGLVKEFNGFNAGLDYAFVPYGAIGATHRFTLNMSLPAPGAQSPLPGVSRPVPVREGIPSELIPPPPDEVPVRTEPASDGSSPVVPRPIGTQEEVPAGAIEAPPMEAPVQGTAPAELEKGLELMNEGYLDVALAIFQDAVAKDPADRKAQQLLGTCLFKMGRLEEAGKILKDDQPGS